MPERPDWFDRRLRRVFNISGSEIIVILLLALVVLGPEKLPDAMRRAGKAVAELRRLGSSFQAEMHEQMDEPMREMRETANLLRGATDIRGSARRAVTDAVSSATAPTPASQSLDEAATTTPGAGAAGEATGSPSGNGEAPGTADTATSPIERAIGGASTIDDSAAAGSAETAAATAGTSPPSASDATASSAATMATEGGEKTEGGETSESPIERALRGGSTIDRAATGEDGTAPA